MTRLEQWNRRVAVATACQDAFTGKPHVWGKRDCLRLARFCLSGMGHKVKLSKIGGYSTARGAVRALRRLGFNSMIDAMDAQGFPRIAPAEAWPADIVGLAADDPWRCALTVKLTGGEVFGAWTEGGGVFAPLTPLAPVAAWRID
jgi:hypothetical protein